LQVELSHAAESVSKACFGVHTRDSSFGLNAPGSNTCYGCGLQDRNLILLESNIRKGLFCQKKKCNGEIPKDIHNRFAPGINSTYRHYYTTFVMSEFH